MTFRRRRAFGRRRAKRSVAWIDGFSGFDTTVPTDSRTLPLSVVLAAAPNTWGAAVELVNPTDLTEHGGEDAVLTRIRGRLGFFHGRRDTGAGFANFGFFARMLIVQSDADVARRIMPFDYTTSYGLGQDDILWMKDILVPASGDPWTESSPATGSFNEYIHEVDVKAKRRVQKDRPILFWLQTVVGGATALDCRFMGGLRALLARPA